MKTHLGERIGLKNLRKRVQNAPKHESVFSIQEHHFALLECRITSFWALAQLPLGDEKAHSFRPFHERMCPDSHFNRQCLFFRVFPPL